MESHTDIARQNSSSRSPSPSPSPPPPLPPHPSSSRNISAADIRSLSPPSFNEVTENLAETNQEVLKSFLIKKSKNWRKELSDLVERYLETKKFTVECRRVLDECCKKIDSMESSLKLALVKYEEEHYSEEESSKKYSETVEETAKITITGNPLSDQRLFESIDSIYLEHQLILNWSQSAKRRLRDKLQKLKTWSEASCLIFAVAFVLLSIWSVVVAIFASSLPKPILTAPLVFAIFLRWLCRHFIKTMDANWNAQREITNSIEIANFSMIQNIDSLRRLVDTFQSEIEVLLQHVHLVTRADATAVVIGIGKIKRKVDDFSRNTWDFHELVNEYKESAIKTRKMVLQTVLNDPSSSLPQKDDFTSIDITTLLLKP